MIYILTFILGSFFGLLVPVYKELIRLLLDRLGGPPSGGRKPEKTDNLDFGLANVDRD